MDVQAVKTTISGGVRHANEATDAMTQVREETGKVYSLARMTTHDSRHDLVTNALLDLYEAHQESGRVIELLNTSAGLADQYSKAIS